MCASFDQPATMIYIALKITEFTLDSRTLYTLAYDICTFLYLIGTDESPTEKPELTKTTTPKPKPRTTKLTPIPGNHFATLSPPITFIV